MDPKLDAFSNLLWDALFPIIQAHTFHKGRVDRITNPLLKALDGRMYFLNSGRS